MRTVPQVMTAAKRQVKEPSRNWTGLCLAFVRTVWGIEPTSIPNANAGWNQAKKRRGDMHPAKGAPVYWSIGQHGHVALSDGAGGVFTTDFRRTGKVDRVAIGAITKGWGATYRGWTEDYCGRLDLPLSVPGRREVSLRLLAKAARTDPGRRSGEQTPGADLSVRVVERALYAEGLLGRKYAFDGSFGSLSVRAYGGWQRRLGYTGKDADGIPGQASLRRLGDRHRFSVVD